MSNPDSPPLFSFTRTFWTGLIFAGLCVPFLVMTQLGKSGSIDPQNDLVGRIHLGTLLLALMFFLPSIYTLGWGAAESVMRHRQAKWRFANPGKARALDKEKAAGPPKFRLPRAFWFGLIFFIGCSGPFIVLKLLNNPALLPRSMAFLVSLMATLSFFPSLVWMAGAAFKGYMEHKKS